MSRTEALQIDKAFYADQDNEFWYVFGDNSGFAYGVYYDKESAEAAATEMQQRFCEN
jgi:hypothetical protein